MPLTVPINHYADFRKQTSYSIISCSNTSRVRACFEHSNFFKVNMPAQTDTQRRAPACIRQNAWTNKPLPKAFVLTSVRRDPTTSFLTLTTLKYAIGAGITTAARTRLAL